MVWPSFIPCPVTLPGRVMSNAKFHLDAKKQPHAMSDDFRLLLYVSLALTALVFSASVFALAVAAAVLSGGVAAFAIMGCVVAGMGSSYGFFKAYNSLSAQKVHNELKKTEEQLPFRPETPEKLPRLALI